MFFIVPFQGTWVSMGVYSDGSYNVPAGLIYSFPVTCKNGEWTIVQGKDVGYKIVTFVPQVIYILLALNC